MIRVLHLSKFYYPYKGGVEQVVQDVCEGLNSSLEVDGCSLLDVRCDVLCVTEDNFYSINEINGVVVHNCPVDFSVSSLHFSFKYLSVLRSIVSQYDILHLHLPNPLACFSLILAGFRGKKVVLHWHSDIVKQKLLHFLYSPFERWLLRVSDAVVATSPNYIDSSKSLQSVRDKVIVVPIGLSSSLNYGFDKANSLRDRHSGKFVIFALGRHVYYKGFEYLIHAAKLLPDNYVVLLGGKGPLTPNYQKLIHKLNVADKVFLIGKVDENILGSYFAMADVFCLPSVERSEAFGVVQIEAMSVGTPVVSCSIPGSGVSWVNKDGVSGCVVEPKNISSLAAALVKVCADRKMYSSGALMRFDELFTASKMNKKLYELYCKLRNI